jgi:hypothetical protein
MLSPFFTWGIFSREQAINECDWLMMTSANQVAFFLFARINSPSAKHASAMVQYRRRNFEN